MKKTLLLSFVALATTGFAASNAFRVNVLQDSVIEGKSVKAGEYKVSVENGNAVFKQGRESIEVPAREETETNKIASTVLVYTDGTKLQEVRVGGTHTKLIFGDNTAMHSGM